MDPRLEEKFEQLLAKRAERLDMTSDEVMERMDDEPRFLRGARARAQKLGISEQELLDRDLQRVLDSTYPGPDCLDPDEVQEFAETGSLPDDRLAHRERCDACAALLEAAAPGPVRVEQFVEEVRYLLPQAAATAGMSPAAVLAAAAMAFGGGPQRS
jgi:hypothetical protein